jgi:cytochrome c oxidase assembly protein subunit 15
MSMQRSLRRRLFLWLLTCAAAVWLTLAVGGITRLTHSGLSIAEWQPLIGIVPPIGAEAWEAEFALYRQTPEYKKVNAGISLDAFKRIFWWEYAHRLLGRVVGLVFGLPLLVLWRRGAIDARLARRLGLILLLGAAQGALGWFMVKSGLVADPHVSQYRLAAHLALALAIFGALLWTALGVARAREAAARSTEAARLQRDGALLTAAIFVMAVSGAFVAGTHAGLAYNTFPLMAGEIVPTSLLVLDPWYLNFFSNPAAIQFDHRLGAWLLAGLIPWFAWRVRTSGAPPRAKTAAAFLFAALALQISLGIATLLLAVPVALAAAHQGGALLVFGAALWLNHELRVAPEAVPPMKMAALDESGHAGFPELRRQPGSGSSCSGW